MSKGECNSTEKMARAMAALFYYMADEMIKKYGDDAKFTILEGIRRFGEWRGQEIRKQVLAAGEELNLGNLFKYYDLPLWVAWHMEVIEDSETQRVTEVSYCPMADTWEKLGASRIGAIYCYVDPALVKGYNPGFKFAHENKLPESCSSCRLVYTAVKEGDSKS